MDLIFDAYEITVASQIMIQRSSAGNSRDVTTESVNKNEVAVRDEDGYDGEAYFFRPGYFTKANLAPPQSGVIG